MKLMTELYARDIASHGNGLVIDTWDDNGVLLNVIRCEDGVLLWQTDVEAEYLFTTKKV